MPVSPSSPQYPSGLYLLYFATRRGSTSHAVPALHPHAPSLQRSGRSASHHAPTVNGQVISSHTWEDKSAFLLLAQLPLCAFCYKSKIAKRLMSYHSEKEKKQIAEQIE